MTLYLGSMLITLAIEGPKELFDFVLRTYRRYNR